MDASTDAPLNPSFAQAKGLLNAARDSREIVRRENTQHVCDDLFVDGE